MTIEDHFKILPQPYQDLAFENGSKNPYGLTEECDTIHDALVSAFTWTDTPEGLDFWRDVALHYLVDSELPEIKS